MHQIAATVGSASIILVGIIFGIFYNQRVLDRWEGRLDKIQADLNAFHRSLAARQSYGDIGKGRIG